MKKLILLPLLILVASFSFAQQEINLEDLWLNYKFYANSVPGFNFQKDGRHYTRLVDNVVVQNDLITGEITKSLFDTSITSQYDFPEEIDGYSFSDDESKILIKTESEAIYRHSTRANFYVWDGKTLSKLFDKGKQRYATFSPDATKVAFVHDNNLYYKNLQSGKVIQVTHDGKHNEIINGATDWVYEEEFGFAKGFQWSPDGKYLGCYRFDESLVKEFTMTNYHDNDYPEYVTFKYPKVGATNSTVDIFIYNLNKKSNQKVDLGTDTDIYVPRIKWTETPNQLCVFKMNRLQNHLQLYLVNANTGTKKLLLEEKNQYYIDIHDNLTFLKDGKRFIWTSEHKGFNHIYLYDMNGKLIQPLTRGKFDVTNLYGVDQKRNKLYYQAAKKSPMQREIYSVELNGNNDTKMSMEEGTNDAQFSSNFDFYVNNYSNINTPPTYTVYNNSGKQIRVIEKNASMKRTMDSYKISPAEFFDFKANQVKLNGYMIKPPNFDKKKKYPVLMYVYGGPGHQTVRDRWGGQNYWWFQMLAQKGYIVVSVDNRGSGARGEFFKKMTYKELGKYETEDQISAAKYLGSKKYIDEKRIGIWGWSYGGYMSSLCILKGNDVFKSAIAVAPVTNWKWYDSIYTERYMQDEKTNKEGYQNNSPVYFTDRLKGNYLIIHGLGDDNVHFQHTAEMVNALVKSNKRFDSYFYPNKNHGIYGGTTRFHLYDKMTRFVLEKI